MKNGCATPALHAHFLFAMCYFMVNYMVIHMVKNMVITNHILGGIINHIVFELYYFNYQNRAIKKIQHIISRF